MKTSRTRTRDAEPEYTQFILDETGTPAVKGNFLTYSRHEEMDDVVIDRFNERIAAGEVINNPCDYLCEEMRAETDKMTNYHAYYRYNPETWYETAISGNFTTYALSVAGLYLYDKNPCNNPTFDTIQEAKQRCLANVDSTPYEFFEDLMELSETLQFLRNPLQALRSVANAYRKKRKKIDRMKDAKRKAKALANLWNQYRFAFAPLLRSVMSAAEAFLEYNDIKRPKRRSAHGYSSSPEEYDAVIGQRVVTGNWNYYYNKVGTINVETHAAIHYEVSNPAVNWNFVLGLRLKDVPVVSWEVIPLSFMVDRLYNIKNMIQGIVNIADPTVTILAGSDTTRTTAEHYVKCSEVKYRYSSYRVSPFTVTDRIDFTSFHLKRNEWTPSIGDTVPSLNWRGLVDDVTKTTDLIALILSRLL